MSVTTQLPPRLPESDTPKPVATESSINISVQQEPSNSNSNSNSTPSAFTKWRPSFHLIAPHSWLNDPCGPGYDPSTGQYHVAFQWNPKDNDWGDIAWGRAISYDLVSWEVDTSPCLVPSASYDSKGIFTGCFQPTNMAGQQDGTLAYFYTSVSRLPIHYTLPYTSGCETLSIALSRDAGRTWERHPENPIVQGPPAGLPVTGWRDPYTFSWPSAPESVTRTHGPEDTMYGLISGGLVGHTPTTFVYAIDRKSMADWKYIGLLLDVGLNFAPSRWTGDFGVNWEVTNLVTLTDDEGTSRDFLIMGTEGCIPDKDAEGRPKLARDDRIQRSQLWMCVKENEASSSSSSSALMQYSYGGIFDSGLFYAANSFWDPAAQQQVLFGWITEDDLSDGLRAQQGWSGLISLPRVLKLQTIHRVKRARTTAALSDISSIETTPDEFGSYTVRTLGIAPDPRVTKLREGAKESTMGDLVLGETAKERTQAALPLSTVRWEVEAEISVGKHCRTVGLEIHHGGDQRYKTVISWDSVSETIQVDRPQCSSGETNHAPEASPHTLFTYTQQGEPESQSHTGGEVSSTAIETEETLRIRALFDASVLEIFVNERTAISTRVYWDDSVSVSAALQFFAEPLPRNGPEVHDAAARLLHATVWDGLACKSAR